MSLFNDWRNQISWGRVCAAVALVVAVWREFTGAEIQHVALWLGVATGSYGLSKLTEVLCSKSLKPGPDAPAVEAAPSAVAEDLRGLEGSL